MYILSLEPHNHPFKGGPGIISPFYRWRGWGPERRADLPKVKAIKCQRNCRSASFVPTGTAWQPPQVPRCWRKDKWSWFYKSGCQLFNCGLDFHILLPEPTNSILTDAIGQHVGSQQEIDLFQVWVEGSRVDGDLFSLWEEEEGEKKWNLFLSDSDYWL